MRLDFNPLALSAYAFEIPGHYPQHLFYQKMGFLPTGTDPYSLYYPVQEGFTYTREEKFIPQQEDKGRVLLFYDPSCPFRAYFNEKTTQFIKEVADVPIFLINKYEAPDEVKKRGNVPFCVVNQTPITSFFLDKENFQAEIRKALTERNP